METSREVDDRRRRTIMSTERTKDDDADGRDGHAPKRQRLGDATTATLATMRSKKRYSIANEFEREISAASGGAFALSTSPRQSPSKVTRRETISPTAQQELRLPGRRETLSPRGFLALESMMRAPNEVDEADMLTGMHDNLPPHVIREFSPEKPNDDETEEHKVDETHEYMAPSDRRSTLDPTEVAAMLPPRSKTVDNRHATLSIDTRRDTLDPSQVAAMLPPRSTRHATSGAIDHSDRRDTLDPTQVAAMLPPRHGPRRETMDAREMLHIVESSPADRRATLDPIESMRLLRVDSPAPSASSASRRETLEPGAMSLLEASPIAANANDRRATLDPAEYSGLLQLGSDDDDDDAGGLQEMSLHMEYSIAESEAPSMEIEDDDDVNMLDDASRTDDAAPHRRPTPVTQDDDEDMVAAPAFASPPMKRTLATPLKSCLSARKPKPPTNNATTPTKTLTFGPPTGAEFRASDPSTAMTPMCERTAKAMFPLEKDEDAEDEETSVNSSILDEADLLADDDHASAYAFGPMQSPRRGSPRRKLPHPVVGVSPLDNLTEARRKRRASFSAKDMPAPSRRQSLLGVNVMADDSNAFIAGSAKKPIHRTKARGATPPKSTPFVDSSSEDEDIDVTGEYFTMPPALVVAPTTNGLDDLLADNSLSMPLTASSSTEGALDDDVSMAFLNVAPAMTDDGQDPTLDLGPVGPLASDPSLFSQESSFVPSSMETLAPILEESDLSRMDMSSDDDDDDEDEDENAEYQRRRQSVVVNLSGRFEKLGSSGKKKKTTSKHALLPLEDLPRPAALDLSDDSLNSSLDDVDMQDDDNLAVVDTDSVVPVDVPPVTLEALFAKLDVARIHTSVDAIMAGGPVTALQHVSPYEVDVRTSLASAQDELTSFIDELATVMETASGMHVPTHLAALYHNGPLPSSLATFYELKAYLVLGGWLEWRTKLEQARTTCLRPLLQSASSDKATLDAATATLGLKEDQEGHIVDGLLANEKATRAELETIEEQLVIRAELTGRLHALSRQVDSLHKTLSTHAAQTATLEARHANASMDVSEATLATQLDATKAAQETYQLASGVLKWRCLSVSAVAVALALQCKVWNATVHVALDVDLSAAVPTASFAVHSSPSVEVLGTDLQRVLFDTTALEKAAKLTLRSHDDVPTLLQTAEVTLLRAARVHKEVLFLETDHTVSVNDKTLQVRFTSQRRKIRFGVTWRLSPNVLFEPLTFALTDVTGLTKAQERAILDRLETVPRGFRRLRQLCQCVERYLDDL
ncbi:hypothetical protein SDRG_12513 [Saprolegnia diclina VS20]|uniref:Spc7 kinetochore protein domain-containing protein n=1 Tax=Saprolegnia diclina (strain VS20) TaxID=1156394 RepID=T0Q548_SAPDV|nr:hypothetical protein SDRG_12513 [Saprolegnia diclina VS20]EQC29741.1 hypothetical protein SDRG_12513 [Saprolegnia diclina VS20]|eukprot:XP_008616807.1 hypothetical protein SDRG_12513 [Saprolegnia diclina VS20]